MIPRRRDSAQISGTGRAEAERAALQGEGGVAIDRPLCHSGSWRLSLVQVSWAHSLLNLWLWAWATLGAVGVVRAPASRSLHGRSRSHVSRTPLPGPCFVSEWCQDRSECPDMNPSPRMPKPLDSLRPPAAPCQSLPGRRLCIGVGGFRDCFRSEQTSPQSHQTLFLKVLTEGAAGAPHTTLDARKDATKRSNPCLILGAAACNAFSG